VAEQAELDGEAEPVGGAPSGADEGRVRRVEDVVPRHLGALGRDAEQARARFGGQQGAAGHGGDLGSGGGAIRKPVAFRSRSERG
jgi:hypothetical protein